MEQNRKLELINLAIQSLKDEKRNQFLESSEDDDNEYQLALSRLLSELERLKGDGFLEQSEASSPPEKAASAIKLTENENAKVGEVTSGCMGDDENEIVKELKKVKRQNFLTHCLLSVMIVLTLTWQLSEVSILMKVKDGLNHPFRSVGSMISGMFKVPDKNGQAADNKEHQSEPSALPSLNIPDMPHVDISNSDFSSGKQ